VHDRRWHEPIVETASVSCRLRAVATLTQVSASICATRACSGPIRRSSRLVFRLWPQRSVTGDLHISLDVDGARLWGFPQCIPSRANLSRVTCILVQVASPFGFAHKYGMSCATRHIVFVILADLHHSADFGWGFVDDPSKRRRMHSDGTHIKHCHIPSARYAAYVCWIALSDSRLFMRAPSSSELGKTQVRKLPALRVLESSFKTARPRWLLHPHPLP
jgi:hypothetical protein